MFSLPRPPPLTTPPPPRDYVDRIRTAQKLLSGGYGDALAKRSNVLIPFVRETGILHLPKEKRKTLARMLQRVQTADENNPYSLDFSKTARDRRSRRRQETEENIFKYMDDPESFDTNPFVVHTAVAEAVMGSSSVPDIYPIHSISNAHVSDPRSELRSNDPDSFNNSRFQSFLQKVNDNRTIFQKRKEWRKKRLDFVTSQFFPENQETPTPLSDIYKNSSVNQVPSSVNIYSSAQRILETNNLDDRMTRHLGFDSNTVTLKKSPLPHTEFAEKLSLAFKTDRIDPSTLDKFTVKNPELSSNHQKLSQYSSQSISSLKEVLPTLDSLQNHSSPVTSVYSSFSPKFISEVFENDWNYEFSSSDQIRGMPRTLSTMNQLKKAQMNRFRFNLLTNESSIFLQEQHNENQTALAMVFRDLETRLNHIMVGLLDKLASIESSDSQNFLKNYLGPGKNLVRKLVDAASKAQVTPGDLKLHIAQQFKLMYNVDVLDQLRDNQQIIGGNSLNELLSDMCDHLNHPLNNSAFDSGSNNNARFASSLMPQYKEGLKTKLFLALGHKAPVDAPKSKFPLYVLAHSYNQALWDQLTGNIDLINSEQSSRWTNMPLNNEFSLFPRLEKLARSPPVRKKNPLIPIDISEQVVSSITKITDLSTLTSRTGSQDPDNQNYAKLLAQNLIPLQSTETQISTMKNRLKDPQMALAAFLKKIEVGRKSLQPKRASVLQSTQQVWDYLYSTCPPLLRNTLNIIVQSQIQSFDFDSIDPSNISEIYDNFKISVDSHGRLPIGDSFGKTDFQAYLGMNGFLFDARGNQVGLDISSLQSSIKFIDAKSFAESAPDYENLQNLSSQLDNILQFKLLSLREKDPEQKQRIEALLQAESSVTQSRRDYEVAKHITSQVDDALVAHSPFGPSWASPSSQSLHIGSVESMEDPTSVRSNKNKNSILVGPEVKPNYSQNFSSPTAIRLDTKHQDAVNLLSADIIREWHEEKVDSVNTATHNRMIGKDDDNEYLRPKSHDINQLDLLTNGLDPFFMTSHSKKIFWNDSSAISWLRFAQAKIDLASDKSWLLNGKNKNFNNPLEYKSLSDLKKKSKLEKRLYEAYLTDDPENNPIVPLSYAQNLLERGTDPSHLFQGRLDAHSKRILSAYEQFAKGYNPMSSDSSDEYVLKSLVASNNKNPLVLALATIQKAVDINSIAWKESFEAAKKGGIMMDTRTLVHDQVESLKGLLGREKRSLEWNDSADFFLPASTQKQHEQMLSDPEFLTKYQLALEDIRMFETLKACHDYSIEFHNLKNEKPLPHLPPEQLTPELLEQFEQLKNYDPALLQLFFNWLEVPTGYSPSWAQFLKLEREWFVDAHHRAAKVLKSPSSLVQYLNKLSSMLIWFIDAGGGPRYCDPSLRLAGANLWATFESSMKLAPQLLPSLTEQDLEQSIDPNRPSNPKNRAFPNEENSIGKQHLYLATHDRFMSHIEDKTIQFIIQSAGFQNRISDQHLGEVLDSLNSFVDKFPDVQEKSDLLLKYPPQIVPGPHLERLTKIRQTREENRLGLSSGSNIRRRPLRKTSKMRLVPDFKKAGKTSFARALNQEYKSGYGLVSDAARIRKISKPRRMDPKVVHSFEAVTGMRADDVMIGLPIFENAFPRLGHFANRTIIRDDVVPPVLKGGTSTSFNPYLSSQLNLLKRMDKDLIGPNEFFSSLESEKSSPESAHSLLFESDNKSHHFEMDKLKRWTAQSTLIDLKDPLHSPESSASGPSLADQVDQKMLSNTKVESSQVSPLEATLDQASLLSGLYQRINSQLDPRPSKSTSVVFSSTNVVRDYSRLDGYHGQDIINSRSSLEHARQSPLDTAEIIGNHMSVASPVVRPINSKVTDEIFNTERFSKVTIDPVVDSILWNLPSTSSLYKQAVIESETKVLTDKVTDLEPSFYMNPQILPSLDSDRIDPDFDIPTKIENSIDPFSSLTPDQLANLDPAVVDFIREEQLF